MKLGIILSTSNPRICWNALQLGVFAQKHQDHVDVFLIGGGLAPENVETEGFDVPGMARQLLNAGGSIHASGTCRQMRGSALCPLSTIEGLHQIVEESDKVLMF